MNLKITLGIFFVMMAYFFLRYKKNDNIHQNNNEKKYKIVCTTMLIADIIQQLVPPNFEVIALMGPGVDPHTYKAKPSDVSSLLSADVILYNGLHLEGKMGEVFESISRKKKVLCVTNGISKNELISAGYRDVYDPHVWHDHVLWKQVVVYIADACSEIFPAYTMYFLSKKNEYFLKLDALAMYIERELQRLPIDKRILITAHDAFHYFSKRYHFTVKALQGLSTESDIGIKDIQVLAELIFTHNVHAIFLESCIPPRNILALQEAVARQGKKINIGGELFSDSLSAQNGPASTYIEMMRYNIKTIIDALLIAPT